MILAILASSAIVSGWPVAQSQTVVSLGNIAVTNVAVGTISSSSAGPVCTVTRNKDFGSIAKLNTCAPGSIVVFR